MKSVEPGINWIWYTADTKEEAKEYYKEITGNELREEYDWVICKLHSGRYGFRIHR